MKALTVRQPWASLIALGVKTVETRSWSTKYRGPLAIHAGMTRPPMMHLPPTQFTRIAAKWDAVDAHNRRCWFVIDTITDPAHQRPHRCDIRDRVPKRSTTPTLFFPSAGPHEKRNPEKPEYTDSMYLPLGAIVTTCNLVDVVAIDGSLPAEISTDQIPFGDWSPGRYGWLLDDISPCASVPARGRQGLWEWKP